MVLAARREALCNWAREVGRQNGFVIVITKSDVTSKGRTARLTLGCERGGYYINRKKDVETEHEKKRRKETGTKKCGWPFALKGKKMPDDDEWMLKVLYGIHNHEAAKYLEGHSYIGRLLEQENSLVLDMSMKMSRPKDILVTLKRKDILNTSTLRTIYNAHLNNRVKEKAGRSQMQYLLGKLAEHKYIEWHKSSDDSDAILDLFWAHPRSVELFRAFPHVLIMDCTYKTNKYRLPLFEIVGVTSTNLTFFVAFVYIQHERENNYTWALNRLHSLVEDQNILPSVIIMDRELSLMNAIKKVFPNARHLLCRWHISKNVLSNCKKYFDSGVQWEKFNSQWETVVLFATESEYLTQVDILHKNFNNYPEALQYVSSSWLTPYKDRFVSAWTDTCMHFGNWTSNRVESAHARLKRQLGCSTLIFELSWGEVHSLIELQYTKIKASFEKSSIVAKHKFACAELKEIRGMVSIIALENILVQMRHARAIGVDASTCGCANRRSHGLPCAHEIAEYKKEGRPIPLDCIDQFWRKLDILPATKKQNLKLMCQPYLYLFLQIFEDEDTESQLQMLKKLREIIAPHYTHLRTHRTI
ncbi:hypothetical protein L1049_019480 [Liquidambar formosana]|uniref:MULE transposase domain-containing protein n=1 Tax=Liquidambar formosana TaxID=63359 RepID=A0AAP0X6J0_LIQFO